jgi:diguanylate cyclase (GGDEF)-like protein/PAS domain S-box-containing protein
MPASSDNRIAPSAEWIDMLPACVIVLIGEHIRYANAAAARLLDAASANELIGRSITGFLHPLDLHRALSRIRNAERNDQINPVTELRAFSDTGRPIVVAMTSSPLHLNGQAGVMTTFLDMTERATMEARLKETDQNFQRIMNTMQDVFYRTDADGITRYVCPAVKNVLGYSAEEIIGLPAAAFYPDMSERDALVAAIRAQGFVHDFPGRMRHKDGSIIDISISTHALVDEQGQFAGVEGIWRDITQRKAMERELQRLATHDPLTGLNNRHAVLAALDNAFSRRSGRRGQGLRPFCVLMLDLDHFKNINDTHGHSAGDAVLRHAAAIVAAQCRSTDSVGRLGGEEFLLVLEDTALTEAEDVAERIRATLGSSPCPTAQGDIAVTTSIGIAQYEETDASASTTLDRADRGLYEAKRRGRNQVCRL